MGLFYKIVPILGMETGLWIDSIYLLKGYSSFAKDILMEFSTDRYKYSHFMELTFAKIIYL